MYRTVICKMGRASALTLIFLTAPALAESELSGWPYVSAQWSYVDGDGVPERIAGANPNNVVVRNGREDRMGGALHLGYQWSDGLVLEAGVLDLGDADVDVGGSNATAAEILEAVDRLQPQTARGLQYSVRKQFPVTTALSVSAGAGLWYWRSEWDVSAGGETRDYSDSGIDVQLNADLGWRFTDRSGLRLRWDRLFLGDGKIDSLGLAYVYHLP